MWEEAEQPRGKAGKSVLRSNSTQRIQSFLHRTSQQRDHTLLAQNQVGLHALSSTHPVFFAALIEIFTIKTDVIRKTWLRVLRVGLNRKCSNRLKTARNRTKLSVWKRIHPYLSDHTLLNEANIPIGDKDFGF